MYIRNIIAHLTSFSGYLYTQQIVMMDMFIGLGRQLNHQSQDTILHVIHKAVHITIIYRTSFIPTVVRHQGL